MSLGPQCPVCGTTMTYQESESDCGIPECYFCEKCDYVIYEEEFEEHRSDL